MTQAPETGHNIYDLPHDENIHDWDMDSTMGGPETIESLEADIISRLEFLDDDEDDEEVSEEDELFRYDYDIELFDTVLNVPDELVGGTYKEHVSLPEFMNALDDERDSAYYPVRRAIESDIANQYLEKHPELTKSWWHKLATLDSYIKEPIFGGIDPSEQLIIGQGDSGIRFYNFGDPMTTEQIEECRQFVDVVSQFYGQRTFDVVTDVVIAPIDRGENYKMADGYAKTDGTSNSSRPGLVIIDSNIPMKDYSIRGYIPEDKPYLLTLLHEFDHQLDRLDPKAKALTLEFAEAAGWDAKAMVSEVPDWFDTAKDADDLAGYAPETKYLVRYPDGDQSVVTKQEYDNLLAGDNGAGDDARPTILKYFGSPDAYGETHPAEMSAETAAFGMLGDSVTLNTPDIRDAWLAHAQKRILKPGETPDDHPLATRLDRAPVVVDHRAGDDILYPASKLPAKIYVRADGHLEKDDD